MLNLFGRPTLTTVSGNRVDILPTGWRLLAALAAGPDDGVLRADLAALLFPTGKLSTLRKLVFDVRKAAGQAGLDLLDGEGDVLRLSRSLCCDVRVLRSVDVRFPLWKIYKGQFFDLPLASAHETWRNWLAEQRDAWRDLYVSRASAVLDEPEADLSRKVAEARHLLAHVPDHAGATRILMLEGALVADAGEVRRRYSEFRSRLGQAGAQPDWQTTHVFHRLVGASQRQLEPAFAVPAIDLPTIHIAPPMIYRSGRADRLMRSLLVDLTIGLHRASLFRVIAPGHGDASPGGDAAIRAEGRSRAYELTSTVFDHVLGRKVAFTLLALPAREVLWTDSITAGSKFTVESYNLVVAGVLHSLIQQIRDVEIAAFMLAADPDAYALFLAGSSSLETLDLVALRRGRLHLKRSLAQSRSFSPVTSALAQSYSLEWLITGRGEGALLATARNHALSAIRTDPFEARGFKALAFCDLYTKRYDHALENYHLAEQLNRNYPDLIMDHACCLLHCGDVDGSLVKLELLSKLGSKMGDIFHWTKASALFLKELYPEVLETVQSMGNRDPVMRLLAATHALMGHAEEARTCRMKAMEIYPTMTIDGWTNTVALRDPAHIRHYAEGLTKAGFH